MDIYEIFETHNRAWTTREIIAFSLILFGAAIVACILHSKKKVTWLQVTSGLVLLIFLAIVLGSTVFTRMPDGKIHYNIELFWSWKAVYHGSKEMLKENLLNLILLFPMGLLLPLIFNKKLSWKIGLMAGFFVSCGIEICQLLSSRGLFEWDDIIHNGIGCMIGCVLSGAVIKRRKDG